MLTEQLYKRKIKFVDKPYQHSRDALTEFDNGEWSAGPKHDGYNGQAIFLDGEWHAISRKNKPLAFSDQLMAELGTLDVVEGTILNGEWEGLRRSGQAERFSVYDIIADGLAENGRFQYLKSMIFESRYAILAHLISEDRDILKRSPIVLSGFVEFFEKMKEDEHHEGVVLKKLNSTMILSPRASAKNPQWLKIKWRGGDDGLTPQ